MTDSNKNDWTRNYPDFRIKECIIPKNPIIQNNMKLSLLVASLSLLSQASAYNPYAGRANQTTQPPQGQVIGGGHLTPAELQARQAGIDAQAKATAQAAVILAKETAISKLQFLQETQQNCFIGQSLQPNGVILATCNTQDPYQATPIQIVNGLITDSSNRQIRCDPVCRWTTSTWPPVNFAIKKNSDGVTFLLNGGTVNQSNDYQPNRNCAYIGNGTLAVDYVHSQYGCSSFETVSYAIGTAIPGAND